MKGYLLLLSFVLVLGSLAPPLTAGGLRSIDHVMSIRDVVKELEWHVNRILKYCRDDDTWAFAPFDHHALYREETARIMMSLTAYLMMLMAFHITCNSTYYEWAERGINFIHDNCLHSSGLLYEYFNLSSNQPYGDHYVGDQEIWMKLLLYAYKLINNRTYLIWAHNAFDAFYRYSINKTVFRLYRLVSLTDLRPIPQSPYGHGQYQYVYGFYWSTLSWFYKLTGNKTIVGTALKLAFSYWSVRNKTTNLGLHLVDWTPSGEGTVAWWLRGRADGTGHIAMTISGLIDLYEATRNVSILNIIHDYILAFDKYYWRPELNRYRYACYADGSPLYDWFETHGLEGFGSGLLRAAILLNNTTLLDHIFAVKELAVSHWRGKDRYDELRTFSQNNTISAWTHARTPYSSQLWWYSFWYLKNMSDLDLLVEMHEWWAENRKTPYGYEDGPPHATKILPNRLYFFMSYLNWFYQLGRRFKGPIFSELGQFYVLSTNPLSFWYCDIRSLRLWVDMQKEELAILVIYAPEEPTRIKMGCSWRDKPRSSWEAFEQSESYCWYWDEETSTLYVKIRGLNPPEEVIIDWTPVDYDDPPSSSGQARKIGKAYPEPGGWGIGHVGIWVLVVLLPLMLSLLSKKGVWRRI